MYAKTTVANIKPDKLDEALETFRQQLMPALRQQPGYLQSTLLVDRQNSRFISMSRFRTAEDLARIDREFFARAAEMLGAYFVDPPTTYNGEVALSDEA